MLRQRRWKILHKFEYRQKRLFLKKLTASESLRILGDLYVFAQDISDKAYYRKLDLRKIHTLSKVHFMFNRVKF